MLKLQELREKQHMTRSELATIMGTARNTVWRWEKGEREPDLASLKKLANLFGCTIDELVVTDGSNPTVSAEPETIRESA